MREHERTLEIRRILQAAPIWFGPPPVSYDGKLVDGRTRFRECVSLQIAIPKHLKLTTQGDVARTLCAYGHHDRAIEWIPLELRKLQHATAFCHTEDRELLAPMFRKPKRPPPKWESRYAHRRAIEQISRLLRAAELTTGTVTADEIRGVLAPWL